MGKILKSRPLHLAAGAAISVVLLYLAFRTTTFGAVWAVLRQANLWWVGAALLSVGVNNLFKVLRWQVLLGPPGSRVPFLDLLMSNLSGQMLNTLAPVRLGDLSRAYVIGGGAGPGRAYALGTVALEKVVDMIWFALLFLLLLLMIPLPAWVKNSAWTFVAAALLAGGLTFVIAAQPQRVMRVAEVILRRLPERWQTFLTSRLHNLLDSLEVLKQRSDLAKIAAWSTLIWATAVLTNVLTLWALDLHLPLSASVLVLVGLMIGISLATVPGRIGVFEWICVLALGAYGVGQAQALSYGLLLHAIVYIPTTLLGVICFFILARGQRAVDPTTIQAE